ncbi:MAG: fused MFS/spermidine synthase, partial [Nannocystaceae bacterium]
MSTIPLQFVRTIAFISGFCALVYQIAWMRHLRLIFGASTGASAAVLAIFMGGLGVGALWIGRKADQAARPLEFYGNLELGVAGTAAVSPVLVDLARSVYFGIGGSQALGSVGAVCVQLVLSSVVLAAPCILMGATLPTLARTVERSEDQGRGELGIIYGVNTLGAVLGCAVTTFFLLEVLGVRNSLWTAAALNTFIGLAARSRARQLPVTPGLEEEPTTAEATTAEPTADAVAPVGFVYSAAAVVGLAFFSMELVWYRMFAPLLGGSSYSFGLILTVALLGIGGGAAVYGRRGTTRRPTLFAFAVTCALEAAFVAIPYGVGDSLAALTLVLRDLQVFGFSGLVVGWACVTMLVVLPPALISGYQFPLLVGLLGSGRDRVAAQVGTTYMWNTVGAIVGSIVSGFGLLIALGATQLWIVMVVVLMFIAAVALAIGLARGEPARGARPVFAGALLVSVLSVTSEGPTSAWRHSPIGAGRVSANVLATQNSFESFRREFSSNVYWEADGRESSVALLHGHGFNFAVSGKVDGHTVGDLPTTVLSGLLGALMHPNPRLAFVIGLGVGSTAGWLGKVPTMERVDVVEFEPAIVGVAKESGPVNEDMFNNPKVRLLFGDGREVLMTSQDQYDIVFSEPSNPYRAGIASLYSQDFYKSAFSK